MTFYNPASLLAGADVAVKAPPAETNTAAFVIGSAMESIRDNLKKKKEVDDLKANTEALANYVGDTSPQLADLLRERAKGYNPTAFTGYDAIDVKGEQANLLKGVIQLSELEQGDRKLAADGNSVSFQNNYSNKLRAAQSTYENENNNFNTWERNEDYKEREYNQNRAKLASEGKADGIPPYQRGGNPYKVTRDESKGVYQGFLNATPEDITGMATTSRQSGSGVSSLTSQPSSSNAQSNYDAISELSSGSDGGDTGYNDGSLFPVLPDGTVAPPPANINDSPPDLSGDPPRPLKDSPIPPLSSKDMLRSLTGQSTEIDGPIEVTPTPNAAPPTVDPIARQNEVAKQRMAANVTVKTGIIDSRINDLKTNKSSYVNKDVVDSVVSQGEKIKEKILSLPDPGSSNWNKQVDDIITSYETSLSLLQRKSSAKVLSDELFANAERKQYYVSGLSTKDPITVYRVDDGTQPRYYVLIDGKREEVTNKINKEFLPLDPSSSFNQSQDKFNVTSDAPVPKTVDFLKNLGKTK